MKIIKTVIVKFIAMPLIQAFTVVNFACVPGNGLFKDDNNQSGILSPEVHLSQDQFQNIYHKLYANYQNSDMLLGTIYGTDLQLSFENIALIQQDYKSWTTVTMRELKKSIAALTEITYKMISPQGIPTMEDSSDEWDEIFEEIHNKLIRENDVFYASALSSFLFRNIDVKKGERVLDYGTGSGIVAVYMVKKGAGYAMAIDNDRRCLDLAKRNISLFNLTSKINLVESDGYFQIDKNEKFDTIIFFAPVPKEDDDEINTQLYDPKGQIIELFLSGARDYLFSDGKVILIYPDNPSNVEKIKELGLKNGLIITKRIKWGTDEELCNFYINTGFTQDDADMDSIKEALAKIGWNTWSIFRFERLENLMKVFKQPLDGSIAHRQEIDVIYSREEIIIKQAI